MSFQQLRVNLNADVAESLSDALMDFGALSSTIEDAYAGTDDEQAIFGEPGEPTGIWECACLIALFDDSADVAQNLKNACDSLNLSLPPYQIETLPEQDWVRLTQAQFNPIQISERLWIVPSWHSAPDENAVNLMLDPGLAFGTGSHPTTKLCLQWLDKNIKQNQTVMDYGCGSGILAIAARLLGSGKADGIDIDPQAVISARQNAEANGVEARFMLPDDDGTEQYDIVLANILANPLRLLGQLLASKVKSGGQIVLSGLLAEQAEEISALYSQWFVMNPPQFLDGWACLSGTKT